MKKIMFLFIILIAIMLTGCKSCKPIPPVDNGLITLTELNGTWDFVSYNFGGTDYNCLSLLPENMNQGFTNLIFDTTEMTAQRINACYTHLVTLDLTKNVNVIKFDELGEFNDVYYVFTVLGYDGTELKLRIDQTPSIYNFLGGTLTLVK